MCSVVSHGILNIEGLARCRTYQSSFKLFLLWTTCIKNSILIVNILNNNYCKTQNYTFTFRMLSTLCIRYISILKMCLHEIYNNLICFFIDIFFFTILILFVFNHEKCEHNTCTLYWNVCIVPIILYTRTDNPRSQ